MSTTGPHNQPPKPQVRPGHDILKRYRVVLGLLAALTIRLVPGLASGLASGLAFRPSFLLPLILLVGLVCGGLVAAARTKRVSTAASSPGTATIDTALVQLTIQHKTPLRLITFLEDARSRHLLRTVGPVYQFRHAKLQAWLAHPQNNRPGSGAWSDARLLRDGGEVPGQLREPRASRVAGHAQQVNPAGPVLDHECRIQPGQGERAVDVEQVDRQDGPGVGAEDACHWSSCADGGGIRRPCRILRIVPAPIRCLRRRSSPWMRTTPQVRLSLARRTISSARSLSSGGRPGARGWAHFRVTIRRCQRCSVPEATIRCKRNSLGSSRDSAASTDRSA